jgi:hypothetical protein
MFWERWLGTRHEARVKPKFPKLHSSMSFAFKTKGGDSIWEETWQLTHTWFLQTRSLT